jgi:hypothetical protein
MEFLEMKTLAEAPGRFFRDEAVPEHMVAGREAYLRAYTIGERDTASTALLLGSPFGPSIAAKGSRFTANLFEETASSLSRLSVPTLRTVPGEVFCFTPRIKIGFAPAVSVKRRVSVLGTYLPNPSTGKTYVKFAQEIGARRFALPDDKFTKLVQRAEAVYGDPLHYNKLYLDSIAKRGDVVRLNISRPEIQAIIQSNPHAFKTLRWEIDDLLARGYSWGDDLKSLVPPLRQL